MDSVRRKLRDGPAEGEQAPAVLIRDTARGPGGRPVLRHLLREGRPLSEVVVVALSDPPASYAELGPRIVDGYSDRLGWNAAEADPSARVWRDARDLGGLLRLILDAAAGEGARVAVFFDSVSVLLRYHSARAVVGLCADLRAHPRVAGLAMVLHADLHDPRVAAAFEYFASTTVAVDPPEEVGGGTVVRVRQKRRNGRVLARAERLHFAPDGLRFLPAEEKVGGPQPPKNIAVVAAPPSKVQFNLGLTAREAEDRARVLLPFEHQGDGREERVYDGRDSIRSSYLASRTRDLALAEDQGSKGAKLGEIRYLRDSDDERPDSDEDPDDDLDI